MATACPETVNGYRLALHLPVFSGSPEWAALPLQCGQKFNCLEKLKQTPFAPVTGTEADSVREAERRTQGPRP